MSQTSVYIVKHVLMWDLIIQKKLPVFHYSNPTISITKSTHSAYSLYVNVKRHFTKLLHKEKQPHQIQKSDWQ